ncbi:hypothetical protein LC087_15310 [Bacillus carboniphilus]|uniref:Uncharacterized protein n=1 Tax=Bacillus carboniphilus TaxID=86663 RepID=A0ABY9JRZ6_9BACI|nr:hypothetical protein [Bacillus carboniphilus]WLR42117.1 hypothetical protein LC087_15310 [Bacillus carboniphilus]
MSMKEEVEKLIQETRELDEKLNSLNTLEHLKALEEILSQHKVEIEKYLGREIS